MVCRRLHGFASTCLLLLCLLLWVPGGLAEGPAPSQPAPPAHDLTPQMAVAPLPRLAVGERVSLEVRLRMPPGGAQPMLLTAHSEGDSVDVVRGRLRRADAEPAGPDALIFRVPLVAMAEGTAVVRLRLDGYVCRPGCEAVSAAARTTLVVRGPAPQ